MLDKIKWKLKNEKVYNYQNGKLNLLGFHLMFTSQDIDEQVNAYSYQGRLAYLSKITSEPNCDCEDAWWLSPLHYADYSPYSKDQMVVRFDINKAYANFFKWFEEKADFTIGQSRRYAKPHEVLGERAIMNKVASGELFLVQKINFIVEMDNIEKSLFFFKWLNKGFKKKGFEVYEQGACGSIYIPDLNGEPDEFTKDVFECGGEYEIERTIVCSGDKGFIINAERIQALIDIAEDPNTPKKDQKLIKVMLASASGMIKKINIVFFFTMLFYTRRAVLQAWNYVKNNLNCRLRMIHTDCLEIVIDKKDYVKCESIKEELNKLNIFNWKLEVIENEEN